MTETIPNLWPTEKIKSGLLSPVAILRLQAENLRQTTGGLLEGDVTSEALRGNITETTFYILAPALNHYRHKLTSVVYAKDMTYPLAVGSELEEMVEDLENEYNLLYTEDEFVLKLREIFSAKETLAVLQSLIARINEV